MRQRIILPLAGLALLLAGVASADVKKQDTIGSLEDKTIELRTGKVILNSSDLARDNYRAFLELVSDDPALRAEAMRRLGDLELEATEAQQLADNIDALDQASYDNAVNLYQQLLGAYPDYRRNDTVLYQLARAYEIGGRTDDALDVLNDLVEKFPGTPMIDEVQFRRGEMLFLRKNYNDAELAYKAVVEYGDESRFYEQSLYKRGWAEFKLAWHEDSLYSFFELLDRKISGIPLQDGDDRLAALSRAEQEIVEDTFRVLSISFSYMDGAKSIDEFIATRDQPEYTYIIYMNLGDLYLDKERFVDAAETYEAFVDQDPFHPKAPLLQVEVIEAYKRGGFPSLVLEGKKGCSTTMPRRRGTASAATTRKRRAGIASTWPTSPVNPIQPIPTSCSPRYCSRVRTLPKRKQNTSALPTPTRCTRNRRRPDMPRCWPIASTRSCCKAATGPNGTRPTSIADFGLPTPIRSTRSRALS
jgi:TolA-binding protein